MRHSVKHLFGKFLLRASLFLFLLEILFRLDGVVAVNLQRYENKKTLAAGADYRIMCLGESMTYDSGDGSYPQHLEKILNHSGSPFRFTIINQAIPGGDSGAIARNLPRWLEEYRPHMVVVMMGLNDRPTVVPRLEAPGIVRTLQGLKVCRIFGKLRGDAAEYWAGRYGGEKSSAGGSRVDPAVLVGPDLRDAIFKEIAKKPRWYRRLYLLAASREGMKNSKNDETIYRQLVAASPEPELKYWMLRKLGEALREQKKYPEYIAILKEVLSYAPHDPWAAGHVWETCRDPDAAEGILSALHDLSARDPARISFYELLGACYAETGRKPDAENQFHQARVLREGGCNPGTRANYAALLALLNEHRVRPVLMQYPLRGIAELNALVAGIDQKDQVILVDNEEIFKAALAQGRYHDYFKDRAGGHFGHLTPRGQELLAGHLAGVILKGLRE